MAAIALPFEKGFAGELGIVVGRAASAMLDLECGPGERASISEHDHALSQQDSSGDVEVVIFGS